MIALLKKWLRRPEKVAAPEDGIVIRELTSEPAYPLRRQFRGLASPNKTSREIIYASRVPAIGSRLVCVIVSCHPVPGTNAWEITAKYREEPKS